MKLTNILALVTTPILVTGGVAFAVPKSRDYILNHLAPYSAVYKEQSAKLDTANKTIEEQKTTIAQLTLDLGSCKVELNNVKTDLEKANEKIKTLSLQIENLNITISNLESEKQTLENDIEDKTKEIEDLNTQINTLNADKQNLQNQLELEQENATNLNNKLNVVYSNVELLYDTYNMSLPAGETLAETRDEQINQKCTAIANFIEDLLSQSEDPVELSAGLYTTGTNTLVKSWDNLLAEGDITFTDGQLKVVNKDLSGDLVCGSVEGLTDLHDAFSSCKKLTSIDLSNLDTGAVTAMYNMFANCSSLTSLDLSGFDTSQVDDMNYMFGGCSSLTNLDLSNFDLSNATDFVGVFDNCLNLVDLNLGDFNINIDNFGGSFMEAFFNCPKLTTITYNGTIAEWKAKNITNETADIKEDGTVTVHCSDGDYVITAE